MIPFHPSARGHGHGCRAGRVWSGYLGEAELPQAEPGLNQPGVQRPLCTGEDVEPEQLILAAGSGVVQGVVVALERSPDGGSAGVGFLPGQGAPGDAGEDLKFLAV